MIGFLIRCAFWLTLVLLFLPEFSDRAHRPATDDTAPAATTGDALTVVQAAIADASGFCERRPAACESGSVLLTAMGSRLREGALTLSDLLSGSEPVDPVTGDASPEPAVAADRGTLQAADLRPEWRAPSAKPPVH